MAASIDTTGLALMSGSIRRAVSGELQRSMVENLHKAAPKIVTEMRGSAFTKIQKKAAATVVTARERDGVTFAGGRGGGLGATLFDGGEYGGRKSRKVVYATKSPRGRAYVVRRRTTMQFLPHLGHEGYFFWTTIREALPKLVKEQESLLEEAMGGR